MAVSQFITHALDFAHRLHPAALLAIVLVLAVMLACCAAGLLARTNRDDCGLRFEGTYSPRIRRHNGRQ